MQGTAVLQHCRMRCAWPPLPAFAQLQAVTPTCLAGYWLPQVSLAPPTQINNSDLPVVLHPLLICTVLVLLQAAAWTPVTGMRRFMYH